jgi:uncharacterized membrane protein
MRAKIERLGGLRESFWFLPAVMSAAAVVLSAFTLELDEEWSWEGFGSSGALASAGSAEGARTLLATIAGSMITVASLTFSITITSLSLASSQFGPRLVRNFIRDRGNQVVLGTFIATFLYCLLVLRTVRGGETDVFVPSISLAIGVVLAVASLAVLIYFINHIAISIQATRIIATIGQDLTNAIERLYPERLDENDDREQDEWSPPGEPHRLYSKRSGYIQRVDYDSLIRAAREADVFLRVPHHPGQFVAKGSALAEVFQGTAGHALDPLEESVTGAFRFGSERSSGRDIEFYIDQLVEIAVRALSTGINDPFTAMEALDQLGASLRQLAERKLPPANHRDEDGIVRVVAKAQTFEGALDAAFNQIRQYGRSSPPVMLRLMETLAVLGEFSPFPEYKQALLRHARLVESASKAQMEEREDIDALEARFKTVLEALEDRDAPVSDR